MCTASSHAPEGQCEGVRCTHTRTHTQGLFEGPVGVQTVQDWRNRCTLRMSVHTLWDPASINLEFQYDTYTGVREHDS